MMNWPFYHYKIFPCLVILLVLKYTFFSKPLLSSVLLSTWYFSFFFSLSLFFVCIFKGCTFRHMAGVHVSFTSCLWEAKGKKHFLDHMHYYERHYGKVGSGQEFQRSKFKTEHCRSMSYVTWIKFLNFFMPGSSHLE